MPFEPERVLLDARGALLPTTYFTHVEIHVQTGRAEDFERNGRQSQ